VNARPHRTAAALVALSLCAVACAGRSGPGATPTEVQYGTRAAPFSLTDQFGAPQRLAGFRGSVVLLTFIDPRCGGVCPLTADLLRRAKEAIAGAVPVELVAIDANPRATAVADVRRWSARHGMLHDWLFLTAPVRRLRRVWAGYGVTVTMHAGDVAHSAGIFLIDPTGRERGVFPIAARSGITAEVDALVQVVHRIA
jgi:cytochrome oxidase Cu insertion factor (SCO1/SenC/PrrC family)